MSHFSVLVIGEDVAGQLAPYQENNMGDCPREFLKFHDTEDEKRHDWETGTVEMVQLDNGERVYTWDERFKSGGIFDRVTNIPEHLQRIIVAHKERWPVFEDYVKEWHGSESRDPEMGRFGYWENPNKKWDWFTVGGRWSNKLLLKDGSRADSALMADVDMDGIVTEKGKEADALWLKVNAVTSLHPPIESWESIRAQHEGNIDEARKVYHNQPGVKALNTHEDEELRWILVEDCDVLKPREQYVTEHIAKAFSTFAVVKDGKWFQRGEMGWWGCVRGEKDPETWNAQFAQLLKDLSGDTRITVVDCHI